MLSDMVFLPFRERVDAQLVSRLLVLLIWLAGSSSVFAVAPAAQGSSADKLSAVELEELVGPVALYPDELLAVVLPASTYPIQIVQAARFLEQKKTKPDLEPSKNWDQSVLAIINYPEAVDKLNDDLEWTERLGDAVLKQQDDVLDAVQQFRAKSHTAGNLDSDEKQIVVVEKEVIRIEPAETKVIYVPSYEPSTVIVQQPAQVVYYSNPYPYYYDPAATFFVGVFTGVAMSYAFDWHDHHIHYGHHGHGGVRIEDSNINIDRSTNINVGGDRKEWKGGERRPAERRTDRRPNSADIRKRLGEPSAGRAGIGAGERRQASAGTRGGERRTAAAGAKDKNLKSIDKMIQRDKGRVEQARKRSGETRSSISRQNASTRPQRQVSTGSARRDGSRGSGAFGGYQRGSTVQRSSNRGSRSRSLNRSGGTRRGGGSRRR